MQPNTHRETQPLFFPSLRKDRKQLMITNLKEEKKRKYLKKEMKDYMRSSNTKPANSICGSCGFPRHYTARALLFKEDL